MGHREECSYHIPKPGPKPAEDPPPTLGRRVFRWFVRNRFYLTDAAVQRILPHWNFMVGQRPDLQSTILHVVIREVDAADWGNFHVVSAEVTDPMDHLAKFIDANMEDHFRQEMSWQDADRQTQYVGVLKVIVDLPDSPHHVLRILRLSVTKDLAERRKRKLYKADWERWLQEKTSWVFEDAEAS